LVARRFPKKSARIHNGCGHLQPRCGLRALCAPSLSIVESLPEGSSPLDELASSCESALFGTGTWMSFHFLTHPGARTIPIRVSKPRHRFRLAICMRHHPVRRPWGHDCLAVRHKPLWGLQDVGGFPPITPGSRPSYLRHAPTLLRLKHLVDEPGTEASPPATAELPRLVNGVRMEFRSLTGVHVLPWGPHGMRRILSGHSCRGLARPRFRGSEPTSPPLPIPVLPFDVRHPLFHSLPARALGPFRG